MYKEILVLMFILSLPIIFAAKTCSEYWGDCSSRTLNDAFAPCNGREVGGDEHVEEVYIAKEILKPNEEQRVTCTFVPTKYWSVDRIYIYYFNGENWTKLLEGFAKYKYAYNESVTFNVGNKEGKKIVRCIISRDPVAGECAKAGTNYDNDDLEFIVLKPLSCNISCSNKKIYEREESISCSYSCNKNVTLFYNFGLQNYTIASGREGSFNIGFSNFDFGGNYTINIFAKDILAKKIYSKNITLKSKAIISSISTPEVAKEKADISCEVRDYYSGKNLEGYMVDFFVNGNYIGSERTEGGVARITYASGEVGEKNISCSIKGNEFYFANSSRVSVVYFSKATTKISAEELKGMEDKIKKVKQKYYEIQSSYLSENFEDELNSIKTKIDHLENYFEKGDVKNFSKLYNSVEREINNFNNELLLYKIRRVTTDNLLFYIATLIAILAPIFYKQYSKIKRKKRELEYYKNRERELIQKRKEIERDYLARKINEEYFNRLILENYDKLSKVRAKIKELSK